MLRALLIMSGVRIVAAFIPQLLYCLGRGVGICYPELPG